MEFTLLWAALTAVTGIYLGVRFWGRDLAESGLDKLIGAAIAGLIGGRIVAMLIQGTNPVTNLGDFLIVRGGVHTGAATITALVTLYLSTERKPTSLDTLAPAALLGLAGWHLGCVWRGACLGTASNLAWAWAEPGSSISRHPVELYAALGLGLAAWLVSRLGSRLWFRTGVALFLAAGIRLVTEPLRLSLSGGPTLWYLTGMAAGLALAGIRLATRSEADLSINA